MNLYLRALAEQLDPRVANTAWIIDRDHLDGDDAGVTGPSIAPDELLARLKASKSDGVKFKMYDDDGELYYTGRILALNDDGTEMSYPECGEEFFAPLDDFGMPNAGCTSIHYQNPTTGAWEAL